MKLRLQPLGSAASSPPFEHGGPVVRLGRDPGCELALGGEDNRAVSWQHARIELTHQGAYLTDLGSSNGTFVNEVRLSGRTPLRPRDVIRLGLSGPELRVVELDLSAARPPVPACPPRRRPPVGQDANPVRAKRHVRPVHRGLARHRQVAVVRRGAPAGRAVGIDACTTL